MLKTIGLRLRKIDILYFMVGIILPMILLFIVYLIVKSNGNFQDNNFFSLLISGKGKFIHYFFVAFLEEIIFRGSIFGILSKKIKNIYLSCIVSAIIFALPHIFNTDNISIVVMFIFPLLYGIMANEMFYFTKSIWMSTGFHWLWNFIITSLFLATGTQSLVYGWVILEVIILIPMIYLGFRKNNLTNE